MSSPEAHPPQRVAPPQPDDERGWFGLVLDLLPLPAVLVDTGSGQIVVRNAVAAGVPPGPPFRVTIGAEEAAAGGVLLRLVSAAAGPDGVAVAWATADGEARYRAFSRVVPPADGNAPLALLVLIDVTAREATERELREALQVRDDFFSVATHELKDPLFSVQLSLQLLRHAAERAGPVPAHVTHHLDVAGRQTDRLARIIENLLDVSRIRSGQLQLDADAIDLAELVREAANRFQQPARSVGSTLTAEADHQVIGYFDRMKLDQVLSNLLTNALKYGAGKPVVVRAREAGEFAVLEVADGGPGIPAADQGRIFARFERASADHKKQSLGLGLYIVRSIAEAHGGTVGVRSEPGRGATFVVTLPRNRLHHKEGPAAGRDPGVTA